MSGGPSAPVRTRRLWQPRSRQDLYREILNIPVPPALGGPPACAPAPIVLERPVHEDAQVTSDTAPPVAAVKKSVLDLQGDARQAEDNEPSCCVCMDNVSDILFHPCRHLCCCIDCARSMVLIDYDRGDNIKCPKCRKMVSGAERVYL